MSQHYYLQINEEVRGPYSLGQVKGFWDRGEVTVTTPVCAEGQESWETLEALLWMLEPESQSAMAEEMGFVRSGRKVSQVVSNKIRSSYCALGLVFGVLGFHNFYVGRRQEGRMALIGALITISMYAMGAWTGIAPMFFGGVFGLLGLWFYGIYEALTVKTDGKGRRMR